MSLYPQAPQTVGKVLDSGLSLYRQVLKPLLPLSLLAALLAQLPQLAPFMIVGAGGSGGALTSALGMFVGFIVWLVVYLALYSGWLRSMDGLAHGKPALSARQAFAAGFGKVGSVLGATFLFALAVVLGLVLFVIPGLILITSLFFYWFLIMLEDRPAFAALKESHRLVWGNWWRTATVLTVGGAIYAVGLFVVGGLAGALVGIGFSGPDPEDLQAGIGGAMLFYFAVQVVLNALLAPMWTAMMLVQFRDLQLRKSGADLAARAAAA